MSHLILISAVLLLALACAADAADTRNPGVPWSATDGLGRALPTPEEAGPPKPGRFVGIFYFLWHDNPGGRSPHFDGPYDIAKILQKDPNALKNPASPYWGPIAMYHYWGEPLYGYYRSDDPWVLRRHAQLLADAGVDTLIFDTTNAATYRDVYMKLCEVFRQVRREGGRTPQIAFMVNTEAGKTAEQIYNDLYKPGLFRELWFEWEGKPLLICDPAAAPPDVAAFFTLRRAHWPFELKNTQNAWHWEATYPQPYGYTSDPARAEQVNVSVAQNLRAADGRVTNMSNGDARGRSFHAGTVDHSAGAVNLGLNFQEQWTRVAETNPPFVMITGWNEWIAGRWGDLKGPLVFVDQFDQECSRDIEPVRGLHNDNYYWQMISNIRRYKGAPAVPKASGPRAIRVDGPFSQWTEVGPEFCGVATPVVNRDHGGAGGTHYANRTARNVFQSVKVARDERFVTFCVRTAAPITPRSDPNWMWLLIRTGRAGAATWEGYDLIVNRTVRDDRTTTIERSVGGWSWEHVADARYRVEGDLLHVAIPREALGLAPGQTQVRLEFKWVDNAQKPGDLMDLYTSGCATPEARFRYRYEGR